MSIYWNRQTSYLRSFGRIPQNSSENSPYLAPSHPAALARVCKNCTFQSVHPGARGPLRKLGQKLKRGSQIEPYRLSHSFNGLLFTILIHFRSNKARRKQFGGPFLVLVSNFLKILVWNLIALASGWWGVGVVNSNKLWILFQLVRLKWKYFNFSCSIYHPQKLYRSDQNDHARTE